MIYNTHVKQQHELLLYYFVDGISFEGESLKHGTTVPPNAFIENVWERARTGLNFAATPRRPILKEYKLILLLCLQ